MRVRLHDNSVLGAWKRKVLKTGFKVQVFENGLCVNNKNAKLWSVQSIVFHYHLMAWQQNTGFLVVFADLCEWGSFCLYAENSKEKLLGFKHIVVV
jgi:hypothetical protein